MLFRSTLSLLADSRVAPGCLEFPRNRFPGQSVIGRGIEAAELLALNCSGRLDPTVRDA